MIATARSKLCTPASSITIWFEPCLRISGSATPSRSIRLRMMSTERSRSEGGRSFPGLGRRLLLRLLRLLDLALLVLLVLVGLEHARDRTPCDADVRARGDLDEELLVVELPHVAVESP